MAGPAGKSRLIIDSHLDLAWNSVSWNRDLSRSVEEIRKSESSMRDDDSRGRCTTSLPELRRGRVAICLATVLVRARSKVQPEAGHRRTDLDVGNQQIAYAHGQGQLAYYRALAEAGEIQFIRDRSDLQKHWRRWIEAKAEPLPVGIILAMEGADPIISPSQAEQWWRDGLRCASLVHYGKGPYAVGTGDSGPLTAAGVELLREFDRLGIILDVTHLSDPSFFQAMDLFPGPIMASHNNCRALVPGDRQFSDEQIKLLIQRQGVIGCALDTWMLKTGFVIGQTSSAEIPLSSVVDHIDHICQLAGNTQHAAIGSDLDGGFGTEQTPAGLDTIADLQKIDGLLKNRGYDDADIDRIFHGNWLRFLSASLPAGASALRRVHVPRVLAGRMEFDTRNSHYLRDVLRLTSGTEIELFDDAGQTAVARLIEIERSAVIADVDTPRTAQKPAFSWTIASAVPKGNRADWMIEKLGEFGVDCWIPLQSARSVVHPDSPHKLDRWRRIAEASARQCRRTGVLRIESLTPLTELLRRCAQPPAVGFYLHPGGAPIADAISNLTSGQQPLFLIGPEGGWTDDELNEMDAAGIRRLGLTSTILRIETAAIAVGAIAQSRL